MRSSESANITQISTWPPKVMRSGKIKNAAIASSHGNASGHWNLCRLTRYSAARSRAAIRSLLLVSLAAIKPRRLDQKHRDRNRVDEKPAGIGQQVFSGRVEYAEYKSGQQRALEAAKPADRDHNQEQHEIDHREAGREAEQLNREPAAKRCQPGADRESDREQQIDIDADRFRHASVVDRRPDLGADIGALEAVPKHRDQEEADRN